MTDVDVLVVGAGPAGLAAATQASRTGLSVEIIEQRETIGGAIYRQPVVGVEPIRQPAGAQTRWHALVADFAAQGLPVRHSCIFLGVDGDGLVLIEDRKGGVVRQMAAKAVIIAVGAVEKVLPRPGWHMAGVSTAGGLQVMMKETGRAPAGRVLLAGSGPLLIAIAAQMTKLGNPPVAIIEAGNPFRQIKAGMSLAAFPGLVSEALSYMRTIYVHGVPWMRAASLVRIDKQRDGLSAVVLDHKGREHAFSVDRIGLHDGIHPNDFGLPCDQTDSTSSPYILRTGDCREALGAEAAIADGRRAGQHAAQLLSGASAQPNPEIARFRRAQDILAEVFAPVSIRNPMTGLPDETVLCRCENRTVGDLRALCERVDALTGREVKHNGRFSMGACQGRFCAVNTAALMAAFRPDQPPPKSEDLTGRRWPLRPVQISALIAANRDKETISQDEQND